MNDASRNQSHGPGILRIDPAMPGLATLWTPRS
jgi:hypothetical protein